MVHVFCEHLSPVDESACNPKPKSVRQTGRYPFNAEHNDLANDTASNIANRVEIFVEKTIRAEPDGIFVRHSSSHARLRTGVTVRKEPCDVAIEFSAFQVIRPSLSACEECWINQISAD